jgi:hypothetical protein
VQASKSMYVPAPVKEARRRVLAPAIAGSRSRADIPEHALEDVEEQVRLCRVIYPEGHPYRIPLPEKHSD